MVAGIHIVSIVIHFLLTSNNITDIVSAWLLTADELVKDAIVNPNKHKELFSGGILISLMLWMFLNSLVETKNSERVVIGSVNIIGIILLLLTLLPILSVTIWAIGKGAWFLKDVVTSKTVMENNFWVGMALALLFYTPSLRPSILKRQTWKKLKDNWLNWWSNRVWAALTLLLEGSVPNLNIKIKMAMQISQFDITTLYFILFISFLANFIASQLHQVGAASAINEESNIPTIYFFPSLILAMISNLGTSSLFWNGAVLTFYAYVS